MPVEPSTTEGAVQEPVTPVDAPEGDTPASADTSVTDANQTPADSSNADGKAPDGAGDKEPDSVLGAVEAALKADKPAADSPSAEDKPTKEGDSDPDKPKGEEGEDELPPFHEHPAWKRVIGQRDEYKAQAEQYAESHGAVTRIEEFLTKSNLTAEEFNTSLQISALMRNDPHGALRALTPYVNQLLEITGNTMPADIQAALDEGTISAELARELSQARAGQRLATSRVEQTEQRQVLQSEATARTGLANAASAWETKWSGSDPDYSKKAELVRENLQLRWSQGDVPKTDAEMTAQCDTARKTVEDRLRKLLPKRAPTTPSPTIGAAGSSAGTKAPSTLLEAMNRALAG